MQTHHENSITVLQGYLLWQGCFHINRLRIGASIKLDKQTLYVVRSRQHSSAFFCFLVDNALHRAEEPLPFIQRPLEDKIGAFTI